jgi:hypothetical protein
MQVRGYGRRMAAALVIVAVAGSLAACGSKGSAQAASQKASRMALASSISAAAHANAVARSSPPKAPVDASFLARTNALCATIVTYDNGHPNPYPSLNLAAPDVATLKKLGAYYAASPYEVVLGKIVALAPPGQNPATWSAFVEIAQQVRGETLTQIKAAVGGDVATFVGTLTPVVGLQDELSDAAHQVGWAPPDACDAAFHVDVD